MRYAESKDHKYESSPVHIKLKNKKKYFEDFTYDLEKEGYKNQADTYFLQNKTVQRNQVTNYDGEIEDFGLSSKQTKLQMKVSPQFVYKFDDIPMPRSQFVTKKVNIYEDVEPETFVVNFRKNLNSIRQTFVNNGILTVKDQKSVHTSEGMDNLYKNTIDKENIIVRLKNEYDRFQNKMGTDFEKQTKKFEGFDHNHYQYKWEKFKKAADQEKRLNDLEDYGPFSRNAAFGFLDNCLIKVSRIRTNEVERLKAEDEQRRQRFLAEKQKNIDRENQEHEQRLEEQEIEREKQEKRNVIKNMDPNDLSTQLLYSENPDRKSLKKKINLKRNEIEDDDVTIPVYLGEGNNVCHEYNWYNHEESAWIENSLIDSFDEDKSVEENPFEEMVALYPKIMGLRQRREEEESKQQHRNRKKNQEPDSPLTRFATKKEDKDKKLPIKKVENDGKIDDSRFKEAVEKTNLDYDTFIELYDKFKKYEKVLEVGLVVMYYDAKDIFGGNKRKLSLIDNFQTLAQTKDKETKIQKALSLSNIEGLSFGKKTANLKRFKKASDTRSFSLIMNASTVDFEVLDDKLYFPLTRGLEFMILTHKRLADDLYVIEKFLDTRLTHRDWKDIIDTEKPKANFN